MPPLPFDNVYSFAPPRGRQAPQRRSLWQLPPSLHCAVIGTCLPIDELRALLDALFSGSSDCDDYALHAGVVHQCATRNKVSQMLQAELDGRYEAELVAVAEARDDADFDRAWTDAARRLDIAGVFWAALTHPSCSEAMRERMVRDAHMIQHLALEALHAQRRGHRRLVADNESLRRELALRSAECDSLRAASTRSGTLSALFGWARRPGPGRLGSST